MDSISASGPARPRGLQANLAAGNYALCRDGKSLSMVAVGAELDGGTLLPMNISSDERKLVRMMLESGLTRMMTDRGYRYELRKQVVRHRAPDHGI